MRSFRKRRTERMSKQGRMLEERVQRILVALQEQGSIQNFRYNRPFSQADREGKDFTVTKVVVGELVERSFGITISPRSWHESQTKYPEVSQLCFPIGTNLETMARRILELFNRVS